MLKLKSLAALCKGDKRWEDISFIRYVLFADEKKKKEKHEIDFSQVKLLVVDCVK